MPSSPGGGGIVLQSCGDMTPGRMTAPGAPPAAAASPPTASRASVASRRLGNRHRKSSLPRGGGGGVHLRPGIFRVLENIFVSVHILFTKKKLFVYKISVCVRNFDFFFFFNIV